MLQLKNRTPYPGTILLLPNADGVDALTTIVKGTFIVGATIAPAEEQLPIVLADQYLGDPAESSIKQPADIGPLKPSTDVLVLGKAFAPLGRPTRQVDVKLTVGGVKTTVRVFGDRSWQKGLDGVSMSPPVPFEAIPLVWERAFGGTERLQGSASELKSEPRNPVGVGFRARPSGDDVVGTPVPNLEDPQHQITSWRDRPSPVGFGPLCPHWEPRRTYAGTYDETWHSQRAPYLPKNFNPRFFQLSIPTLVAPAYLQGGEPIEVIGACPSGSFRCRVPNLKVTVTHRVDNQSYTQAARLDTIIIEPEARRVILVWRTTMLCDKKAYRIRQIDVSASTPP